MLDLTRQSGIVPSGLVEMLSVHIVGAGAVGSHAAEVLCKMGIRTMKVSDFDTIEAHNLPNQGYLLPDIGKLKVAALSERLSVGTGAKVEADASLVEESYRFTHDIVVSAVDSMRARMALWEAFKASEEPRFFIDGRMGARHGKLLVADRTSAASMERYAGTLHSDAEGHQAPCTEKATIFCAYAMGALIGGVLCNYAAGEAISPETDIDLVTMRMTRSA